MLDIITIFKGKNYQVIKYYTEYKISGFTGAGKDCYGLHKHAVG